MSAFVSLRQCARRRRCHAWSPGLPPRITAKPASSIRTRTSRSRASSRRSRGAIRTARSCSTATNADGTDTEWDAETASIAVMRNRGAEPSAVVVGDRVTIAGAPSRARPQRDPRAQHAAVARLRVHVRRRAGVLPRRQEPAASSAARRSKPTSRRRRPRPTASSASGRRS